METGFFVYHTAFTQILWNLLYLSNSFKNRKKKVELNGKILREREINSKGTDCSAIYVVHEKQEMRGYHYLSYLYHASHVLLHLLNHRFLKWCKMYNLWIHFQPYNINMVYFSWKCLCNAERNSWSSLTYTSLPCGYLHSVKHTIGLLDVISIIHYWILFN